MKRQPPHPALVLFLLSPVLAELVSGYLAPLEFLNPARLALTLIPYGCSALAARELLARRRKGWVSLVLLGLAFGLLFEGLVTRVIFNPAWQDLGALAGYGRAVGVNWVLAVGIVHFQATVAIVSPVLLVHMLYPHRRDEPWIGPRLWIVCGLALPVWALVFTVLVGYTPPWPALAALAALAGALIVGALWVPSRPRQPARPATSPPVFGLVAGTGMALVMTGTYLVPEWARRPPPGVTLVALLALVGLELGGLTWLNRAGTAWADPHRFATVAGFLAFFVVFGAAQDFDAFAGRSLVSIGTVWALVRLGLMLRDREARGAAYTVDSHL